MTLQEYQLEARKTAHHTAHLGMEYCVMKIAEELGELDQAIGSGNREAIKLEGGDVFWHLADIYTRYGVVITERVEEIAFRRVDDVTSYSIQRHLARASGTMCGAVAKGLSRGVEPNKETILAAADIVLALTCKIMRQFNHILSDVLVANLAKLAARQAAGTVLGGDR